MRVAVLLCTLVAARASAFEPVGLSEDEFKMFRHGTLALGDERVLKLRPEARLGAIARDAGYSLRALTEAMRKGEAAGDLKARCEADVRESVERQVFAGRLSRVELDVSAEHAVAYVQWLNEDPKVLPVEASLVAARTASACPIASSIQLWAHDRANTRQRVFQALISASGARRIDTDKAVDFAQTRYLKLFEKVKSVGHGDDLSASDEAPPPTRR
jgi:hypothetical protein